MMMMMMMIVIIIMTIIIIIIIIITTNDDVERSSSTKRLRKGACLKTPVFPRTVQEPSNQSTIHREVGEEGYSGGRNYKRNTGYPEVENTYRNWGGGCC